MTIPVGCSSCSTTRRRQLAFAVLATIVFFGVIELVLRLVGFTFRENQVQVYEDGQLLDSMFRTSAASWWEPIPDAGPFNEDGFVGPLIPKTRKSGVFRLAALGDSCTQWGNPPYPELLRQWFAQNCGRSVEVLNAGVVGFSTHQGLTRLKGSVLQYRPDVVTICFGWNDHWLRQSSTDRELMTQPNRSRGSRWFEPFAVSRVVQGCMFVSQLLNEYRQDASPIVLRVPIDEYKENLRQMVRQIRHSDAEPVLVTAPTDIQDPVLLGHYGKRLKKNDLRRIGHTTLNDLHQAYVEATREVANKENVLLVDAAAAFEGRQGLLTKDHIHLTQRGAKVIARLLGEAISRRILRRGGSPPPTSRSGAAQRTEPCWGRPPWRSNTNGTARRPFPTEAEFVRRQPTFMSHLLAYA